MANTLMATSRPYVLLSSTRASLHILFHFSKKPFASFSAPLVRSTRSRCLSAVLPRGETAPSSTTYCKTVSRVSGFGVVDIRSRNFSTRSSQINDAGSIDQTLMQSMEKKIREQLNAESVSVKDMSGDGRHVCINVVSTAFEGQSAVNRQRMVYKAIWEELQNAVHAVDQMTTKTPSEADFETEPSDTWSLKNLRKKMSDLDKKNNNETASPAPPDLYIQIKGVPFHLHKEILAKRSAKVSLLLGRNEINELTLILRDIEADPDTFELVARFCYGCKVKFSSKNIVSVLCIAYHLEMDEKHSLANLFRKAYLFLEQRVLLNWNTTVIALRSGNNSLHMLKDIGLMEAFFNSLIEKASNDPELLHDEAIKNREEINEYRRNPWEQMFVLGWKSEDLITIPLSLYEPLMIQVMKSGSIPAEYITLSIYKYAHKWVFEAEESLSEQKRKTIEAVERLLPQQRGLVSCAFLFQLLKHSIWLEASYERRYGFEIRIGKQLDMATPTDLKILSRAYGEKAECFEDMELVKNVFTSFCSDYANEDTVDVSRKVKVAKLLEEFMVLAASEASLKLEAFVALAGIAMAISKGVLTFSDGIYRAIDTFLESHIYLTEPEKMEVCKVLECCKLSQEGCVKAAKNSKLPLRIVERVLFVSQFQICGTVAKKIKGIDETGVSSDEVEMEKMSNNLLGLGIQNYECVVHRWKKLKRVTKINVLEEVNRKFGRFTSSSSLVEACNCDVQNKKRIFILSRKRSNHITIQI